MLKVLRTQNYGFARNVEPFHHGKKQLRYCIYMYLQYPNACIAPDIQVKQGLEWQTFHIHLALLQYLSSTITLMNIQVTNQHAIHELFLKTPAVTRKNNNNSQS